MTDQESGELGGAPRDEQTQLSLSFPIDKNHSLNRFFCVVWTLSSLPLIVCKDNVFLTHRLVCLELRTQRKGEKGEKETSGLDVCPMWWCCFFQHQASRALIFLICSRKKNYSAVGTNTFMCIFNSSRSLGFTSDQTYRVCEVTLNAMGVRGGLNLSIYLSAPSSQTHTQGSHGTQR